MPAIDFSAIGGLFAELRQASEEGTKKRYSLPRGTPSRPQVLVIEVTNGLTRDGGALVVYLEYCLGRKWSEQSPGLIERVKELRKEWPGRRVEVVT